MVKRIPCLILILFQFWAVSAQHFYIPWNIEEAYRSGSRDKKGIPGPAYFQNTANYKIAAEFDPVKGTLHGKEEIIYKNNSPDSLYYLVIRLYHDVYRIGNLRDEEIDPLFLNKGVEITSLRINGLEYIGNIDVYLNRSGTNLIAGLREYFLPGEKLQLEINWTTKIPPGHVHRFGNYGSSDWFVAYWYPQIAVYDDIDGWDMLRYTGQYEFYNDFNSYDIEITVPKNHMVWATGNWQNADMVLSPGTWDKYRNAQISDKQVQIIGTDDWAQGKVLRKNSKNIFRYTADNISDFAFAVSDNYLWDAASVITDSASSRRTVVHAVYSPEAKNFSDLATVGARAVYHFTHYALGIEFPYPNVTLFNGDGGMEFPMMVNQRDETKAENYFVAMHEIFHAYFPFFTGCNEKKYAWLDEGLATYLPIETENYLGGGRNMQLPEINRYYTDFAGSDMEVPLMTPSVQSRNYSYYHQAYYRSAVAFSMLESYLGKELFRGAVREFVRRWQGKHPTGYDFLFTLTDNTGKDLDWLINPWFFGQGWADVGISGAKADDKGLSVLIENTDGFPVPVDVRIILTNDESEQRLLPIESWKNGDKIVPVYFEGVQEFKRIEISNPNYPDKNQQNNTFYP